MKKTILVLCALIAFATVKAQTAPLVQGFITVGQLLNLSNGYVASVYADTATNATTKYLTIPTAISGSAYKLLGIGSMDIKLVYSVVSGTARGTCFLESSTTGLTGTWATDDASKNFTIDSAGVTLTNTWHVTKNVPYWRIRIAQTGTGVNIYQGFYYFQKAQIINTTK